jgi:hypothetical protein
MPGRELFEYLVRLLGDLERSNYLQILGHPLRIDSDGTMTDDGDPPIHIDPTRCGLVSTNSDTC